MKKFSNVSGAKVPVQPTIDVKQKTQLNEKDIFAYNIFSLIDECLSIRSYGTVSPVLMMPVRITGKEMFVEALIQLLNEYNTKDQVKLLESLKETNTDWESIDNKINDITNSVYTKSQMKSVNKIKSLFEKYSDDTESLIMHLDNQCNKIKSKDVAFERYEAANKMFNDVNYKNIKDELKVISDKYLNKYQELSK